MTAKRKPRAITSAQEARIQAGIARDSDNPEWTSEDFRRAKPFAKAFPELAKSGVGADRKRSRPEWQYRCD